ncbi:Adenylate cyclase type 9 [Armadillidium nasatum]|uniref:adenylate cyclase n=1 Tax=Armadillidium nasatum TaxID=96803 RepID=A0A5N5SL27_9CRUS|nr:Adenylate cyclase type 9 [Armadillidium nasatum]
MDLENEEESKSMLEEEVLCLAIPPQIHAQMLEKHKSTCCPKLFERASSKWWNPKFDSDILEQQYIDSSLPKLTIRFRYALSYALLSTFVWSIYWMSSDSDLWAMCVLSSVSIAFLILVLIFYSHHKHYQRHRLLLSCVAALFLMGSSLLPFGIYVSKNYWGVISKSTLVVDLSAPCIFTFYIEVLLLVYTIIPLPLYLAITLCTLYTVVFEVLTIVLLKDFQGLTIVLRILLHLGIHLIGSHIMIMNEVRMRGTFMSVGQSLLVRRQFEIEKALKEKMIQSVMPPKVANWLMEKAHSEDVEDYSTFSEDGPILRKVSSPRSSNAGDSSLHGETFRPFNMNIMDNVSILFADIVGFTRMSSNKTAEQLVGLLNDLFGRFDELCVQNGCEKINTLGDCYYAVSGCPEPRTDHAECCVNMGLAMIKAIKQFDADTHEDVNMRVGVHTGKVLCGIVGTMRFKFDVWSQDVSFANHMESTGKPGQVHITDTTYQFLPSNMFLVEDGPVIPSPGSQGQVKEHKTYFITGLVDVKEEVMSGVTSCDSPLPSYFPTVASDIMDTGENRNVAVSDMKSSSLPNMIDCLVETDSKGKIVSKSTAGAGDPSNGTESPRGRNAMFGNNETATGRKLKILSPSSILLPLSSPPSPSPAAPPPTPKAVEEGDPFRNLSLKDPRKDSGIRSRRSSIQDEMFSMNGLNTGDLLINRVSDYFTTSHSSVSDIRFDSSEGKVTTGQSVLFNLREWEKKFLQMRKQSDLQLIKCVQQERRSYITVSPLSPFTLFFVDTDLEKQYRESAHQLRKDEARTLACTIYNTYFDILITVLIFLCVSSALAILFGFSLVWLVLFVLFITWHVFILLLCLYEVVRFTNGIESYSNSCLAQVYKNITRWSSWHACGASLLCLPICITLAHFTCTIIVEGDFSVRYFCYIVGLSVIHFCNFTQLNWWMKNALATIGTIVFLVLIGTPICSPPFLFAEGQNETNITSQNPLFNLTLLWNVSTSAFNVHESNDIPGNWFHKESIVAYSMLLLLVWLLNREFEISYRLSYYGYVMAMKDKHNVQNMKNQAEWLLHNIIPKHVANIIKSTAKYSENHKNVGVMFASIMNFNELYNEDYSSGKEYLRFLNELVADFDELLTKEQFKNIEKIKTIGSTYMAASGLNHSIRKANAYQNQHICDLVDFAREMFRVIENFNQNMIGFKFILRIGINNGDVTAGVIGTTKLFYDIWGDTVNIASRMDSTGLPNKIQVTEECANILRPMYSLEQRGSVYVKGKDHMNVFLLNSDYREEKER